MKFDLKPEQFEEFKEYMAKKMSSETGKVFLPEDIFITEKGFYMNLKDEDKYKFIFGNVRIDGWPGEQVLFKKNVIEHLEYIIGDLVTNNHSNLTLESLGSIKYIDQNLIITGFNSKLKDFGDLREVGVNLNIEQDHSIKTLGTKLKKIGEDLLIDNSDVESLGSLEYIGGSISLRGCNLKDIGNLKYVGGFIIMSDEQAEIFGDKVYKDGQHYYFRNEIAKDQEFEI